MIQVLIHLTDAQQDLIGRRIVGDGGFQNFLRRLVDCRSEDGQYLLLSAADAATLVRYATSHGSGGFQGRMDGIAEELQALARNVLGITGQKEMF